MPRGRRPGHKLSWGTKKLISEQTKRGIARTRTVACPHCLQPVDRYTLRSAQAVLRPNWTTAYWDMFHKLHADYDRILEGVSPMPTKQMLIDDIYIIFRLIESQDPHTVAIPTPPTPPPLPVKRLLTIKRIQTRPLALRKPPRLYIRSGKDRRTTPDRATPPPSATRQYALYRVASPKATAIRVGEFAPTHSMATALLGRQAYHDDGDETVQVHWFEKWTPSSVEYPAYVPHIVRETE